VPAGAGVPLSRWSCPDLAACAISQGITAGISASTIRRMPAADAIKPWQYRSWLFTRDPDFAVKASRVLDLYSRVWDGSPPGDGGYVISAGEKTSILSWRRGAGSRGAAASGAGRARSGRLHDRAMRFRLS